MSVCVCARRNLKLLQRSVEAHFRSQTQHNNGARKILKEMNCLAPHWFCIRTRHSFWSFRTNYAREKIQIDNRFQCKLWTGIVCAPFRSFNRRRPKSFSALSPKIQENSKPHFRFATEIQHYNTRVRIHARTFWNTILFLHFRAHFNANGFKSPPSSSS